METAPKGSSCVMIPTMVPETTEGTEEYQRRTPMAMEASKGFMAEPQSPLLHPWFPTQSLYGTQGAALAFYILFSFLVGNFVVIFVVTALLAALDFWVVKNVSGRILVGLRWWNEIDDQGESVWRFECLDQESMARLNNKDSRLFWWTLYLNAGAWLLLSIFSLIRFKADYILVVGVCLTLSIANIVGFTQCRKDDDWSLDN